MNESSVLCKEIFAGKFNKLVHSQDMHDKTKHIRDSAGSLMTRLTVSLRSIQTESECGSNIIALIIFGNSYWIQISRFK